MSKADSRPNSNDPPGPSASWTRQICSAGSWWGANCASYLASRRGRSRASSEHLCAADAMSRDIA